MSQPNKKEFNLFIWGVSIYASCLPSTNLILVCFIYFVCKEFGLQGKLDMTFAKERKETLPLWDLLDLLVGKSFGTANCSSRCYQASL